MATTHNPSSGSEQLDRAIVASGSEFILKDKSENKYYFNNLINSENKDEIYLYALRYVDQLEGTLAGTGVDLLYSRKGFATQIVGSVSGTNPSMVGKIQESDNNSSWSDIPGAVFAPVTSSNNVQVIHFSTRKRYIRHYAGLSGTDPVAYTSVVFAEYK